MGKYIALYSNHFLTPTSCIITLQFSFENWSRNSDTTFKIELKMQNEGNLFLPFYVESYFF